MNKCPLVHIPCGACGHEIREDGTCGCPDNRHPIGPAQERIRGRLADENNRLRELLEKCAQIARAAEPKHGWFTRTTINAAWADGFRTAAVEISDAIIAAMDAANKTSHEAAYRRGE